MLAKNTGFIKMSRRDELIKELKEITNQALAHLDHKCLNDILPFTQINPSSENVARFLYNELKRRLSNFPVNLLRVSVWESENSKASYFESKSL